MISTKQLKLMKTNLPKMKEKYFSIANIEELFDTLIEVSEADKSYEAISQKMDNNIEDLISSFKDNLPKEITQMANWQLFEHLLKIFQEQNKEVIKGIFLLKEM